MNKGTIDMATVSQTHDALELSKERPRLESYTSEVRSREAKCGSFEISRVLFDVFFLGV